MAIICHFDLIFGTIVARCVSCKSYFDPLLILTQVASYRDRCKLGGKSLSARSGLTNPLQTLPLNGSVPRVQDLDMAIQAEQVWQLAT